MLKILTKREKEIFDLLIDNKTTDDIANMLNISSKTVRNHISNVILKLDVKSRSQAIIKLLILNELKIDKIN
ncbi:MAG: helix-turn-helix transcriptional regulator [Candidatus Caccosoma sp.]|nr:helix-turn-helix transcriptional regulator [Candidatus Caccosoma sp.]